MKTDRMLAWEELENTLVAHGLFASGPKHINPVWLCHQELLTSGEGYTTKQIRAIARLLDQSLKAKALLIGGRR